jgi:hypothetical protein
MHNNDWNWLGLTKSPTKTIDWPLIDSMNALGCIWSSSQSFGFHFHWMNSKSSHPFIMQFEYIEINEHDIL